MNNIIVVGIGNPYRGDDGAGFAVIDGLEKSLSSSVKLLKLRGDIAELIDIFANYQTVYLVDACRSNEEQEDWRRLDVQKESIKDENPQTSTHGFGITQAISLAKNLDKLPDKLILYAINGNQYSISDVISPSVYASVNSVIKAILNEEDIRACMNKA